jgi:transposase
LTTGGHETLRERFPLNNARRRLANIPRCLIGMKACSGSHHIGRQLAALGDDVRLIPA